jgi:hypothetical protein
VVLSGGAKKTAWIQLNSHSKRAKAEKLNKQHRRSWGREKKTTKVCKGKRKNKRGCMEGSLSREAWDVDPTRINRRYSSIHGVNGITDKTSNSAPAIKVL